MHLDSLYVAFDPRMRWPLDAAIAVIVFGVALELRPVDLLGVLKRPKGALAALAAQALLLPASAFLLGRLFSSEPSVALGLILVASCPIGSLSNLMTRLAGGNTALSMTVTALSTLAASIMIPLSINFWGSFEPGAAGLLKTIALDRGAMMGQALLLIGVPLFCGSSLCALRPELAKTLMPPARRMSLFIMAALALLGLATNWRVLAAGFTQVAGLVALANVLALSLGYSLLWALGCSERDRRAATLALGMQNTGLALVLIFRFFGGMGGMAVVAALWGLWNMAADFTIAKYWEAA